MISIALMSTKRFVNTRGQGHFLPLTQDSHSMTISNISSKATMLMVTKLYLESPGVEETKICSSRPGHMTNMVTMPVYDKSL